MRYVHDNKQKNYKEQKKLMDNDFFSGIDEKYCSVKWLLQ